MRSCFITLGCLLVLNGCSRRCQIGEVAIRPSGPVVPGAKVELTASVHEAPAGTLLCFTPSGGECSPTSFPMGVFTTFQAPSTSGVVYITVSAKLGGVNLDTRVCKVLIEQAPVGMPPAAPPAPKGAVGPPAYFIAHDYLPSGWMGDAAGDTNHVFVQFDAVNRERPLHQEFCQRWSYSKAKPDGAGWAAVAWQFPEGNVGAQEGKDLSRSGFTKVLFSARGASGGEVVRFFVGGHTSAGLPHQASFDSIEETIMLDSTWQEYSIDIRGQSLASVVCAFGWVINNFESPVTFFLEDIRYAP